MGDKSPKSKQRDKNQKTAAKVKDQGTKAAAAAAAVKEPPKKK